MSPPFARSVAVLALAMGGCDGGCSRDAKDAPPPAVPQPAVPQPAEVLLPASEPAAIDPSTAARLQGVVRFEGTPPKREEVPVTEAACHAKHATILTEEVIVTDGALANVLVHVKQGLEGRIFVPPAEPAILGQQACVYVPHVLAMQHGQRWIVRSSDPVLHNVHTYPKKSTGRNLPMPAGSKELELTLKEAELSVPVRCDVHPWMAAVAHVLKHPYFAVTDASGHFSISGLPPGRYKIEALHERLGSQTQEIELAASAGSELNFSFSAR
jgi:carboxypeptidase family protein